MSTVANGLPLFTRLSRAEILRNWAASNGVLGNPHAAGRILVLRTGLEVGLTAEPANPDVRDVDRKTRTMIGGLVMGNLTQYPVLIGVRSSVGMHHGRAER